MAKAVTDIHCRLCGRRIPWGEVAKTVLGESICCEHSASEDVMLDMEAMVAMRDAARVSIQQSIEVISEGVTKDHFAVSSLLESKFRRALTWLLQARDELK